MANEGSCAIADIIVGVGLVECSPAPVEAVAVVTSRPPLVEMIDYTPATRAAEATIEQTGAGPPPEAM